MSKSCDCRKCTINRTGSDRTPTTDEIRFSFAMHESVVNSHSAHDGTGTMLGIHFDEFDRWFATVTTVSTERDAS